MNLRRSWLTAALVAAAILALAAVAISAAPHGEPGLAEGDSPAAIPGWWLPQRLGTPDRHFTFLDADRGWAASSALPAGVYRTTDGGVTWDVAVLGQDYVPYQVNDITFISPTEGWATGSRDYYDLFLHSIFVVHTTDGGATWTDQISREQSDEVWAAGERIFFTDSLRGWVEAGSYLWRTTNGGASWVRSQPVNMPEQVLRFTGALTGFGRLTPPATTDVIVMRTTDAGATWAGAGPAPSWTVALWVGGDGATAWASGQGGQLARSTNLGVSWTSVTSPTAQRLDHLRFTDLLHGWVAGQGGAVMRTTDGGWNWQPQYVGTFSDVTSLAAAGDQNAWVYPGELRRTRNAGATWSPLQRIPGGALNAVRMDSFTLGWAGGSHAAVLQTGSGWRSWLEQPAVSSAVRSVDTVDAGRAWALTTSELKRTTDGGGTWSTHAPPAITPFELDFVNATTGWLVGDGSVYRTTDGGQSWAPQYTAATGFQMRRVAFVDTLRGWALGTRGMERTMMRTTDGGATWTGAAGFGFGYTQPDMDFVDAARGWGVDGALTPDFPPGRIARTTDGGMTWLGLRGPSETGHSERYTAVDFLNATEGWVVGTYGLILRTTDGGTTWAEHRLASRISLRAVHAVTAGQAWLVGDGGLIRGYSASEPPGCWTTPTPLPPYGGVPPAVGTVQRRVAHCMDDTYVRVDTEELLYYTEYVRMGAREGGAVPYTDGLLFRDVRIPQGALITSARLRLEPWGYQSGAPIVVTIAGEAHGQAGDFSTSNWWAHLRPRTAAHVPWTINAAVGGLTESPDISAIIEEIVARPDWQPGHNLAVLIDAAEGGQQFIDWMAYDRSPAQAAELIVAYNSPATATPTATATRTARPTLTATPTATRTARPTATATRTARPTLTATPTATRPYPAERRYLPMILR